MGNGGCEHQCINTAGAFYCECDKGYTRQHGFYCKGQNQNIVKKTHFIKHIYLKTQKAGAYAYFYSKFIEQTLFIMGNR